jgi:hypothetical protein
MKKSQFLMLTIAFVIAIGAAAAPKAIKIVKAKKGLVSVYSVSACTTLVDCNDLGSITCGYAISGCTGTVHTKN